MSLAASPTGKVAIAEQEKAASTSRPRTRTITAKTDVVSDPEAR